jgi:hypothetical protein
MFELKNRSKNKSEYHEFNVGATYQLLVIVTSISQQYLMSSLENSHQRARVSVKHLIPVIISEQAIPTSIAIGPPFGFPYQLTSY